ncbi:MAG: hypothetical protein O2930_15130 [Acidobacteria bacterium]|nr:hypothetical protein [Acidobacteriota bacterium]
MPALAEHVQHNLAVGQATAATLPQGTVMQWMALRRGGPNVVRNIRWDGDAPLAGFAFTVDDLNQTYHFFVPSICGNISYIRSEPSLEAARRARFAEEDAARAAAQAAADANAKARLAAEQAAAEHQKLVAEQAAAAEQARLAREQYEASEAARLAAEQALADYLAAEQRDLRVRPFLAGYVGKQQRQYDNTDPAGLGRLPVLGQGIGLPLLDVPAFFDTLVGLKGGVALKMAEHVSFSPAIGVAVNVDQSERTSLFGDAEIDFLFGSGAYVGTGITFWDITHTDSVTAGWLGTFGVPLWTSTERLNQALFSVEYRQMFDRMSDPDVNYQVWGGLKYLFR